MQPSQRAVKFAGDVSIDKVKIVTRNGLGQDVSAQVIAIQIFEDIFSPFITGSLILRESFDLINLFPFAGEEIVEIEISTPSLENGNIKANFYIYKLTDRELLGDKSVVYQLHFISQEAIVDMNKKVSRVFGDKPEVVVDYLAKDEINGLQTKKKLITEPTSRTVKFISNFWSPTKAIQFVTHGATNKDNSPSYVFFENRDGFNFVSLESLYSNKVYQEFTYDKYTRDSIKGGGDSKNVAEDYKRINTISIPLGFDYIDRIKNGLFASKMISYDLTKKQYNMKPFNMFDSFEGAKHLNEYNIASSKSIFRTNSTFINFPRANSNFSGFGDATNYRNEQKRISLMKAAEANKIQVVVPGRCDYTVGQKVNVKLYKVEPIANKGEDNLDKMFSGNYIIAAINHYINRDGHECNMELIKDTLMMKIGE
jgi:hypothetical protein